MKSNSPIHGADSNWKPKGVNVSHLVGLTPPDRVRGSDCDNLWKTSCFMMWPWCQGNSRTSCFMIEERKCGWDSSDSQEHVRLDTLQPPCLRHPYLSLSQDHFFPPSIQDVTELVFSGPHKSQIRSGGKTNSKSKQSWKYLLCFSLHGRAKIDRLRVHMLRRVMQSKERLLPCHTEAQESHVK